MDVDRLAKSPIGSLIDIAGIDSRTQQEYRGKAYLPDPLPPAADLASATHACIARTAASVARADQAIKQLPNPSLLVRPTIRREAVSTSALEGTYAAFTDVLEADFLTEDELSSSVAEVRNFVLAAEEALRWIEDRPITLAMLDHLQKILIRATPADTAEAGHIRATQVLIGGRGRRVEEARFIPPPPGDHLRDGCLAWQDWIRDSHPNLHPIAVSALSHYQFETLHPFNDGNGRLGRLVALLQLITARELQSFVVNLSPWLKQREDEYQKQLFEVSATGNFDPWVGFDCAALQEHGAEAVDRVHHLLALRQQLLDRARGARVRGVGLLLAGDLIGYPMVTARSVAETYNVSPQAANTAVGRLNDLGILRQRTEGRYARIFSCDAVLSLLE